MVLEKTLECQPLYQQLSGARAAPISSLIINCQPHYQHLLAAVAWGVGRSIPGGTGLKNPPANAGDARDAGSLMSSHKDGHRYHPHFTDEKTKADKGCPC